MNKFWKTKLFRKAAAILAAAAALLPAGCGRKEPQEGPITLTYATFDLDFEMAQWIERWNQSQSRYRVEILEYENSDTGRAQLNNEIVSGKSPDLFDLAYLNVSSFVAKGLLEDLNPYLDSDRNISREDLLANVLQAYESGGGLYGILPEFRLELLAGKKALTGDASDWTVDRLLSMAEELSPDEVLVEGLAPTGLLRAILAADMGDFVNWEEGTCSFDGEKFKKLLTTAGSLETVFLEDEELTEGLKNDKVRLCRIYITEPVEYVNSIKRFGDGEISLLGFPSETGGRAVLTPRMPVGISKMCGHKDGAWEFVRSLLEEEFQRTHVHFCLPVRLDILREELQAVMTENPYGDGPGSESWEPAEQEEIDTLYDGLSQMKYSTIFDETVWNIVSEEAEPYFEGEKSVEDVMNIIQRRVSLYVSENYETTAQKGSKK